MTAESPKMQKYFDSINKGVMKAYKIAEESKKKGFDPDDTVNVPLAKNMAERVEGLISTAAPEILGTGIVDRITEFEGQFGSQDWRVALKIAEEVAMEKFCKFETKKKAIETGIRIGFAYVTVGVVSSPLEGFTGIKFKNRKDNGKEYFCLMYSGPIRSAGGTGASVSVLIADYIRKKMGYAQYDATEQEINRMNTELADYHERVTNLQYFPSTDEVEYMLRNMPVQIDGDPSEKFEVSNYKDLDRIETNRIRNGPCLVVAECLCAKAPKLLKKLTSWGKEFNLEQWDFINGFVDLQKKIKASLGSTKKEVTSNEKVTPDFTYIKDLVGGRPVVSHPLRNGGFRLRYGRTRTSGFSSDAIHPATMAVLNNYIAIGTQLKMERPGKSTTLTVCDSMDGPIVKLVNGSVKKLNNYEEAVRTSRLVSEILYLGDILINYGDFRNRNHKLLPAGFVEEWWVKYLEGKSSSLGDKRAAEMINNPYNVFLEEASLLSKELGIPLHPRYIFYWNSLTTEQFKSLYHCLQKGSLSEDRILLSNMSQEDKRSLEIAGIEHLNVPGEYVIIENIEARALLANLSRFEKKLPEQFSMPLDAINAISEYKVKDKCGYFIGARMGRPEKAKLRKLKGNPNTLFPVGEQGGKLRSFSTSMKLGKVTSQFPIYYCEKCIYKTVLKVCENCGNRCRQQYYCRQCGSDLNVQTCLQHGKCQPYKEQTIDIQHYMKKAQELCNVTELPESMKGVRGTSNAEHIPEHIAKGLLRAKHHLTVNKDGTIRYDMTEMGCTHFKPKEVGASIKKLIEMGYDKDIYGNALTNEDQILELLSQDIILPACSESPDEGADESLFRVANFIDDILVKLYGLESYYNLTLKEELIGHLVVAMSPHTSAGIVSRIVGFSRVQGLMAHPLLHSIMRRDLDGDECAVLLLMDHLLNFSSKFLPNSRGSTQDAPLVLTSKLIPSEVDDMVFDMDIAESYPLEFYEAAEQYKSATDVKVKILNDVLNTEKQYEGMMFTHHTSDFNQGVRCSAYKTIPTMQEKVLGQMDIAKKIRAVDEDDVARLVVEKHFMRDIKGCLRKFSMQSFRCTNCNEIFRRPPMAGKCTKCDGRLAFTIAEGSVKKYLEPAINLAETYNLPSFLKQTLELTKNRIESVFGRDVEQQANLGKWFTAEAK